MVISFKFMSHSYLLFSESRRRSLRSRLFGMSNVLVSFRSRKLSYSIGKEVLLVSDCVLL
jgi:hypothetical protein